MPKKFKTKEPRECDPIRFDPPVDEEWERKFKESESDKHTAILCDLETAAKATYFKVLGENVPMYNAVWESIWSDACVTLDGDETDIEQIKNEIDNSIATLISDLERVREAVSTAKVEL